MKQRILTFLVCILTLCPLLAQPAIAFFVVDTEPIINTFIPPEYASGSLIIAKTVEHPFGAEYQIPDHLSFFFQVELGKSYAGKQLSTDDGSVSADENGTVSVQVKPGDPCVIHGVEEGDSVTVTEVVESGCGFTVKGEPSQTVTIPADRSVTVEFINSYHPAAAVTDYITLSGTKVLEGRDWQPGDEFVFLLEQANGDGSWSKIARERVEYDPSIPDYNKFDFTDEFRGVVFDRLGEYAFRVSEEVGTLVGMAYDPTVKYFSVSVTDADMDGVLEIGGVTPGQYTTVKESSSRNGYDITVDFNNTYTPAPPADITLDLTVEKTVRNLLTDDTIGPENFVFVLRDEVNELKRTTDENGSARFSLTLTAEDIGRSYHYTLFEKNDGRKGVSYDETVYDIRITVSLGQDNTLQTKVFWNGTETEDLTASFENTYEGEKKSVQTGDGLQTHVLLAVISGAALLLLTQKRVRTVS